MTFTRKAFFSLAAVCLLAACETRVSTTQTSSLSISQRRAFETSDNQDVEKRIANLLDQMTVEEKIGQMTQLNSSAVVKDVKWDAGTDLRIVLQVDTAKFGNLLRNYYVGSILNGIAFPPDVWYSFY